MRSLTLFINLLISYAARTKPAVTGCTLTKASGRANPTLPEIFAYNQINGAVFFDTLFDSAELTAVPKAMWSGQMRFPSGTSGNFWYMPNATYLEEPRCQISGDSGDNEYGVAKDFCKYKKKVDKHPPQTFSTQNFLAGFGGASPVTSKDGHLYLLNVLMATKEEIMEQLRHLKQVQEDTGAPIKYLEWGNEVFLSSVEKFYGSVFPDVHAFFAKVTDSLLAAKEIFPNAIRMVPYNYPFCHFGDCNKRSRTKWNGPLNDTYSHLFEALTIHDYSACMDTIDILDKSKRIPAMLAWGDAAMTAQAECVNKWENLRSKPIWMTEWSSANFVGTQLWGDDNSPDPDSYDPSMYQDQEDLTTSAVQGIFFASYLLKSVDMSFDSVAPVKGTHHQLLNHVSNINYGNPSGLMRISRDRLQMTGAGQIVAHLSWFALHLSDKFRKVTASDCGELDFKVQSSTGLSCLHAVAFEKSDRNFAYYVVINRCNQTVDAELDTGDVHKSWEMRTTTYDWDSKGNWKDVDVDSDDFHPVKTGPIDPTEKRLDVGDTTTLTLQALSLTFVDYTS